MNCRHFQPMIRMDSNELSERFDTGTGRSEEGGGTMQAKAGFAVVVLIIAVGSIGYGQVRPNGSATQWKLVKRSTFIIEYPDNDYTAVTMVGTLLNVRVGGRLEARRRGGLTQLKILLNNLPHPQDLGVNYTSYVVW